MSLAFDIITIIAVLLGGLWVLGHAMILIDQITDKRKR